MAAFLDVHLEQVAHVVERRRGLAEMALLLDRGRLGVALDHDQAAQRGAILARHFLPGLLALVHAEVDLAAFLLRGKQNAPAIFGHAHVIELGPAFRVDAHRGAQIDQRLLETFRPHVVPPVEIAGVPLFQRALDAHVFPERDIVRDQAVVVDLGDVHGTTSLLKRRVRHLEERAKRASKGNGPGFCVRHPSRVAFGGHLRMTVRARRAHHTLSLLKVGETPLP
jgi:hypothetical protein